MVFQDRDLTCVECGQSFVFNADDQQYHADKGYTNEPKRCTSCRQTRRSNQGGGGGGFGGGMQREMHPAVCAECGKDTEYRSCPEATDLYTATVASGSSVLQVIVINLGYLPFIQIPFRSGIGNDSRNRL